MSTQRQDDTGLDRLLRAALEPVTTERVDVCPDADTIAAYSEGGLTARERTDLEPHLSTCGRCQTVLAVLVRECTSEQPAAEAKPSAWRVFVAIPSLRWLVPASAAALGVILYVAVQQDVDTDVALATPPAVAAPEMTTERAVVPPLPDERATSATRASSRATEAPTSPAFVSASPGASAKAKRTELAARASEDVVASAPPPAQPEAQPAALAALERPRTETAPRVEGAARQAGIAQTNVAGGTSERKTGSDPRAVVRSEAAPERGKRVRLYTPSFGTGFTLPAIWPFSDLVVRAHVSAVGRARLAPAEHAPGQIGLAMALVPMVPIEFEIVEVFKRRDGIHPGPSITVWHRGGEVEDAVAIHRVPDGDWVQTREGDEFVLFLERRDNDPDSRAFEPFGFVNGLYRLDGDRVLIGVNSTPDPELTRSTLLARLRQLAGTAAR